MFIRAYLRASTREQDATRARDELHQFAKDRGWTIAATYIENESGATLKRPELFRLLSDCQPGDVLLVEQVDRLKVAAQRRCRDEDRRRLQGRSIATIKPVYRQGGRTWPISRSVKPLRIGDTLKIFTT
jgi:DNA invertase Pin-like site-specific DNA recombinase